MTVSNPATLLSVKAEFGGSGALSSYLGATSGITSSLPISLSSFAGVAAHGSALYDTPGTYSWTCPAGVTSVYVVCIGGGSSGDGYTEYTSYCYCVGCVTTGYYSQNGGGGGGLAWKTVSVSPGTTYTVQVGSGGSGGGGGLSWFGYDGLVTGYGGNGYYGGSYTGDGGGNGGLGGIQPYTNGIGGYGQVQNFSGGGGGAGGYSGPGGNGMSDHQLDDSAYNDSSFGGSYGVSGGSGGGGGGGGYSSRGGGVGVYGEGDSGGAGSASLYFGGRAGNQHYAWPGG